MKIKSFDRKAELLDAALDEFIHKSYEEASLNNMIRNAGISKGTFYYHFQDKQSLYLSLLQSCVDAKIEFLNRRMVDYKLEEKDKSFFENLKLQSRIAVEFAKDSPRYYLFGMMFFKEKGNKIYDVAMNMLEDISERYFEELLEKAIDNGDIRDGISGNFSKKVISYLLTRYDEIFNIKEEGLDLDLMLKEVDDLIDFIQYGLGSRENNNKNSGGREQNETEEGEETHGNITC